MRLSLCAGKSRQRLILKSRYYCAKNIKLRFAERLSTIFSKYARKASNPAHTHGILTRISLLMNRKNRRLQNPEFHQQKINKSQRLHRLTRRRLKLLNTARHGICTDRTRRKNEKPIASTLEKKNSNNNNNPQRWLILKA